MQTEGSFHFQGDNPAPFLLKERGGWLGRACTPKTQIPLELSTKSVQHFVTSSFRWLLTEQMDPKELSPFCELRVDRTKFTLWAP